jgi:hypothetical protein
METTTKLFNVATVVDLLDQAYAESDYGKKLTETEFKRKCKEGIDNYKVFQWYAPILAVDWKKIKSDTMGKGANSIQRAPIMCTINGVTIQLCVGIKDEKICGWISPIEGADPAEIAWVKEKMFNKQKPIIPRQRPDVQIQIQKYPIAIKNDADGKPIIPEDVKVSMFYRLMEHLHNFLNREIALMKARDRIVSAVDESTPPDAIVSKNLIVCQVVQKTAGAEKSKKTIPNPMARTTVAVNDGSEGARAVTAIFDKTKAKKTKGPDGKIKMVQVEGTVDGKPLSKFNIHRYLVSGTVVSGVINIGFVVFSNQGISIPSRAKMLITSPPRKSADTSADEFFKTMGIDAVPTEEEEEKEEEKEEEEEEDGASSSHGDHEAGEDLEDT